jgi:hypothetical protein
MRRWLVTGLAGLGLLSAGIAVPASGAAFASSSVPACTAGDLGVWVAIDQGNGTAGSTYFPLQFTNLGRHACSLHGFPGVSAVGRSGQQLGSPAAWDHVRAPRTVVLAAGATAHAELQWIDAAVSTAPGCRPTSGAFGLRVYPPNQRTATHAEFNLEVCSHAGPVYMNVGPVIPGVGTING